MESMDEHWAIYLPPILGPNGDDDELSEKLDGLVEIASLLGIPDVSYGSYSQAIGDLTDEKFVRMRRLNQLNQLKEEMKYNLAALKHELQLISLWNERLTPGSSGEPGLEPASILERRKEALVRKAKEHHKRLEELMKSQDLDVQHTIAQYLEQKAINQAKDRELKDRKARVKAFQGLPANLDLARHELREARREQLELIQLRENLLRRMASNMS